MSYLRAGAGSPVVLIHGSLTTADDMALALFEKLSGAFDVLAFDRPGHGESDRLAEDPGSPRAQGRALLEALRLLAVPAPIIVGHSFGGAVALTIAMDSPDEIAGVVAVAPICFPELRLEHGLLAPRALPFVGEAFAETFGRMTTSRSFR